LSVREDVGEFEGQAERKRITRSSDEWVDNREGTGRLLLKKGRGKKGIKSRKQEHSGAIIKKNRNAHSNSVRCREKQREGRTGTETGAWLRDQKTNCKASSKRLNSASNGRRRERRNREKTENTLHKTEICKNRAETVARNSLLDGRGSNGTTID